jgi:flagellar protein FlaF
MSLKAYQKVQTTAENPRETEYRLFGEVTRSLVVASESGKRDEAFYKALDWNRRLWSTLSTDCGIEGNGLSKTLRAGIISLAIWVSKHSSLVARAEESIDDLIKVNKNVMEGLKNQVELQKQQAMSKPLLDDSGAAILQSFSAEV